MRRWTNLKLEVKLRFGPMHRNSVDASNLKAPYDFFFGRKAPKKKIGSPCSTGHQNFFWDARLASGRAMTRGFKTSRSRPRGFRMSWRGARGFRMSSPGARGFSRGAQGVQVNPLNPLPVAPCDHACAVRLRLHSLASKLRREKGSRTFTRCRPGRMQVT